MVNECVSAGANPQIAGAKIRIYEVGAGVNCCVCTEECEGLSEVDAQRVLA
jgi:hypothetical protein